MKITQNNGRDKLSAAVKFRINSSFLAVSTRYVTLKKKIETKGNFNLFTKKIIEIMKKNLYF